MNIVNNYKRYNSLDRYYKEKYGVKVAKVSLDANFTCPNKDGTKGFGGCSYCLSGSNEFAGDYKKDVIEQFEDVKKIISAKWPNALFIPYLQANSNTYGSVDELKKIYEPLTKLDHIAGISIATRCDCFTDEIYEYLSELNKRIPVQIELGLQTSNEKTADLINRCHSLKEFDDAVYKLDSLGIEVVTHVINGLPGETEEDMLNTVKHINSLPIKGVKFHSLLILKGTAMAKLYEETNFHVLTLEEYTKIVCDEIEILRPDIIVHRLGADSSLDNLIAPMWTHKKLVVMNEIDKLLRKRNTYQGIEYEK